MSRPYSAAALTLALSGVPAFAAPPSVVTDIPAVASLVDQVMGSLGQPVTLLDKSSDPHHYQMRPSQARALNQADLLVWIGPELTPWLSRHANDESKSLPLLAQAQTHLRHYAEGEHHHDHDEADEHGAHEGEHEHADEHKAHEDDHAHADEHKAHEDDHAHADEHKAHEDDHAHADEHKAHEDEHAHADDHDGHAHEGDEHGHDHSGVDPHAWLDPGNGVVWLGVVADRLSTLDPENAETYRANAQAGADKLRKLDAELSAQLAALKDAAYVTFHDAYGYFTDHYGLQPALALAIGDASPPSAAHLREIEAEIKEHDARCAFPELGHRGQMVTQISESTGMTVGAELDPTGSALPLGPDLFAGIQTSIATTLTDCLSQAK